MNDLAGLQNLENVVRGCRDRYRRMDRGASLEMVSWMVDMDVDLGEGLCRDLYLAR